MPVTMPHDADTHGVPAMQGEAIVDFRDGQLLLSINSRLTATSP